MHKSRLLLFICFVTTNLIGSALADTKTFATKNKSLIKGEKIESDVNGFYSAKGYFSEVSVKVTNDTIYAEYDYEEEGAKYKGSFVGKFNQKSGFGQGYTCDSSGWKAKAGMYFVKGRTKKLHFTYTDSLKKKKWKDDWVHNKSTGPGKSDVIKRLEAAKNKHKACAEKLLSKK